VEIERVQRPFWAHQLVEYLVAVALISVAVQQPQPAVPALLGGLVLLNAAVAKGAAGAFRLVGKRLHRTLDLVVIALLVVGAVQPWASLDNVARMVLGGVAFVLFFIWFHTDFSERPSRLGRAAPPTTEPSASAAPARPRSGDRTTGDELTRRAGRIVGGGINAFKRWQDDDADRDGSQTGR
jgi:hypothetical protein